MTWRVTHATRFGVLDHGYVVLLERDGAEVEATVVVHWRRESGQYASELHVDSLQTRVRGEAGRALLDDARAWIERNDGDVADATVGAR